MRSLPPVLHRDHRRWHGRRYALIAGVAALLALVVVVALAPFAGPIRADWIAETIAKRANARFSNVGHVSFSGSVIEWVSLSDGVVLRLEKPLFDFEGGGDPLKASEIDLVFAPLNLFRSGLRPYGVIMRKAEFEIHVSDTAFGGPDMEPAPEPASVVVPAKSLPAEPVQDPDEQVTGSYPDVVPLPPRRNPPPPATVETAETEQPAQTAVPTTPLIPVNGLAVIRDLETVTAQFSHRLNAMIGDFGKFGLKRVQLEDSILTVEQGGALGRLHFVGLEALLETRTRQHIEAQAQLLRNDTQTPISFSIDLGQDGKPQRGSFRLEGLSPETQFDAERLPVFISTPISIAGDLAFDDEAKLHLARFSLDIGAGAIGDKAEPDRRLFIDKANLAIAYDLDSSDIAIENLAVQLGRSGFSASGRLTRWAGDPSGRQMQLMLHSSDLVLDEDGDDATLAFSATDITGIVDPQARMATINGIRLAGDNVNLSLTARLGWGIENREIRLQGVASDLGVKQLRNAWLPIISPGARSWVYNNIKSGTILAPQFGLRFLPAYRRAPGAAAIETDLKIGFSNGVTTYFNDLPPIALASGNMEIHSSTMRISLGKGGVDLKSGRRIGIESGSVDMDQLGFPDTSLAVLLHTTGDAAAYIDFVKGSGLPGTGTLYFGPDDVAGQANADLKLTMWVNEPPETRDVQYTVNGTVSGFASDAVVAGHKLTDGDFDLIVTRSDLSVDGLVAVDGAKSRVSFRQPFGASAGADRAVDFEARLNAETRKAIGLDLGDFVEGETPVRMVTLADEPGKVRVEIDLTPARVALESIGWIKQPGTKASLSFVAPQTGETRRLDDFSLTGGGITLGGWVEISAKDGLVQAEFSTFSLGKGDSARASIRRANSGRLAIDVAANSLDIRKVIAAALASEPDPNSPGLDIAVNADRLKGHNATTLNSVIFSMSQSGGRISRLQLSAQVNGRWPVSAEGGGSDKTRLSITSADGGGLMRFLDLYRWADGGALNFTAVQERAPGRAWSGTIKMTDFNVRGDPAVDRYFLKSANVARSREDDDNGGNTAAPVQVLDRVEFTKLRIDFTQSDGVFTAHEGVVKGPILGATFQGALNTKSGAVGITGTFVPAYGINNALSQVPILGRILGGKRDEGVIGVTFKVAGTTTKPDVTVNAFSAIAPGIFRRIFEFDPPT
ncbi:MAG: hypothetical protein KDJ77_07535 [Rhodobiaceae bacterium]|nr:hypothetical protein [Rhodobiaceae bacterium]